MLDWVTGLCRRTHPQDHAELHWVRHFGTAADCIGRGWPGLHPISWAAVRVCILLVWLLYAATTWVDLVRRGELFEGARWLQLDIIAPCLESTYFLMAAATSCRAVMFNILEYDQLLNPWYSIVTWHFQTFALVSTFFSTVSFFSSEWDGSSLSDLEAMLKIGGPALLLLDFILCHQPLCFASFWICELLLAVYFGWSRIVFNYKLNTSFGSGRLSPLLDWSSSWQPPLVIVGSLFVVLPTLYLGLHVVVIARQALGRQRRRRRASHQKRRLCTSHGHLCSCANARAVSESDVEPMTPRVSFAFDLCGGARDVDLENATTAPWPGLAGRRSARKSTRDQVPSTNDGLGLVSPTPSLPTEELLVDPKSSCCKSTVSLDSPPPSPPLHCSSNPNQPSMALAQSFLAAMSTTTLSTFSDPTLNTTTGTWENINSLSSINVASPSVGSGMTPTQSEVDEACALSKDIERRRVQEALDGLDETLMGLPKEIWPIAEELTSSSLINSKEVAQ